MRTDAISYFQIRLKVRHREGTDINTFILHITGEYERIEFDLQHQIRLGLMRNIYYRFGFGAFTNQDELYFVDFANFSQSMPKTGSVFPFRSAMKIIN